MAPKDKSSTTNCLGAWYRESSWVNVVKAGGKSISPFLFTWCSR